VSISQIAVSWESFAAAVEYMLHPYIVEKIALQLDAINLREYALGTAGVSRLRGCRDPRRFDVIAAREGLLPASLLLV